MAERQIYSQQSTSDITELRPVTDNRTIVELFGDNMFIDISAGIKKDFDIKEYESETAEETLSRLKRYAKYPDRIEMKSIIVRDYAELLLLKSYRQIVTDASFKIKMETTQKFCDNVLKKLKLCKKSTNRSDKKK